MAKAKDNSQPAKRPRIDNAIQNVIPVNTLMKISDLNIDCLEEIFDHLSGIDLLNVADTNTRFRKAAVLVVARRIGCGIVFTTNFSIKFGFIRREELMGLVYVLRFLRCFGHLITHLDIYVEYAIDNDGFSEIIRYVNEYCAQNLLGIHINGSCEIIIDNISKEFVKLMFLSLNNCTLGRNLKDFNKWFPQMKSLSMSNTNILDPKCIELHFPHSSSFSHDQCDNVSSQRFNEKNLKNFIRLNPQLKSFSCDSFSIPIIRHLIKYLHQLDTLNISSRNLTNVERRRISLIRFKSVKSLKIELRQPHSLPVNSFLFEQLKIFVAIGMKFKDFQDFVKKHSTITELTIDENKFIGLKYTVDNILDVVKTLPSLSSLTVKLKNDLSIDNAVRFMVEIKQLKEFAFAENDRFEASDLEKRFGNEWRVNWDHFSRHTVILERNVNFNH